jgi:hypothetical protein
MNDIPGIDLLPEKLRVWAVLVILWLPFITRAYFSITKGGGLKSILAAFWLGTNTPKEPKNETLNSQP